jgi:hypothetical protein
MHSDEVKEASSSAETEQRAAEAPVEDAKSAKWVMTKTPIRYGWAAEVNHRILSPAL